jgi:hypothetical protein
MKILLKGYGAFLSIEIIGGQHPKILMGDALSVTRLFHI